MISMSIALSSGGGVAACRQLTRAATVTLTRATFRCQYIVENIVTFLKTSPQRFVCVVVCLCLCATRASASGVWFQRCLGSLVRTLFKLRKEETFPYLYSCFALINRFRHTAGRTARHVVATTIAPPLQSVTSPLPDRLKKGNAQMTMTTIDICVFFPFVHNLAYDY